MEKLPFFALAAGAGCVTFLVQQHSGGLAADQSLPLGARTGNALIAYCRYLAKMIWPTRLAVYYPHPGYWPLAQVLLAGGLLLGLSALFFVNWRRYPFLLAGWLWFCGMLVPVIGLTQSGWQAMADRYAYLPSVGFLVLVAWGAYELTRRWRHQAMILSVTGAVAVVLCLGLTHRQLGYWRNSETLFRHALAVTDNNYFAHENLGTALFDQGQYDAAIEQFQQVMDYNPTHYNLALAYAQKGDVDAAIDQFQQALRINPDQAEAHYNLGIALAKKGQTEAAIAQYQAVVRLQPDNVEAHYNLGTTLGMAGRLDDAIRQLQEVIRLKPDYVGARNNLGVALFNNGQRDAAIVQFQEIVRLRPDDAQARQQLANALALKSAPADH